MHQSLKRIRSRPEWRGTVIKDNRSKISINGSKMITKRMKRRLSKASNHFMMIRKSKISINKIVYICISSMIIMKQITISVPENKFSFFVKVVEPTQSLEDRLTAEQRKTWDNIKQGFNDLKLNEEGKLNFRPVQEL